MEIRLARPDDVPEILRLVRELAAYEQEPDAVRADEDSFRAALFPADRQPAVFAHVAEATERPGQLVGMAVWFLSFSTWTGVHGIWLEDLFVEPAHRGSGVGTELLRALARECVGRGFARLEWTVLDWNEPARGFYRSLGAQLQDEWTTHRLTGAALEDLAGGVSA